MPFDPSAPVEEIVVPGDSPPAPQFDPSQPFELDASTAPNPKETAEAIADSTAELMSMASPMLPVPLSKMLLRAGGKKTDMAIGTIFPLAGSAAGTFVAPVVGTAVGGGAGGVAGEALVEMRQILRGERENFSPGSLIGTGVVSAVIPKPLQAGGGSIVRAVAKAAGQRAGEGALLGGAQEAIRGLIDEGELTLANIAESALWGSVFGSVFGALERGAPAVVNKIKSKSPKEAVPILREEGSPQAVALADEIEAKLASGEVELQPKDATPANPMDEINAGIRADADATIQTHVPLEEATKELARTPPAKVQSLRTVLERPDIDFQYSVWDADMVPPGGDRTMQIDVIPTDPNEVTMGGLGSTNRKVLAALGVDLPPAPDWLPPGSYTRAEIAKAIADGPPASAEVGLGAASPKEFQPVQKFTTSIKNAVVDQERVARGEPPIIEVAKKDLGAAWDEGMAKIDENQNLPDELIAELKEAPRPVKDYETAVLLQRKIDLQNEFNKANRNIAENIGTPESLASDRAAIQRVSDELLDLDLVSRTSGTEQGRGLNARKLIAAEDFSLSSMMTRRRAAKGGAKLTPEEEAQVREQHAQIVEAERALSEHAEKPNASVDEAVSRISKEPALEGAEKSTDVIAELKRAVRDNPELDDANFIQRITESFVREGIKTREPLIDAVHAAIKDIIPGGITRRQTMDAISGYGQFRKLDPDKIKAELRDLRGQMQQVGKLQDMESGRAPAKTGGERRAPSDEERRLIKQVEEAKRKGGFKVTDPATQLKTALSSIKTRLQNSIRDLEQQIATKTKTISTKTGVKLDAEAEALKGQRDKLKAEFDSIFGKTELTDTQRISIAEKSADRQISEIERQLKENEIFPKSKQASGITSPELEAKRAKIEALKEEREYARTLGNDPIIKVPKTPEEISLQAYKTRVAKRIAELHERMAKGDFSTKPKRETVLDDQGNVLQAKLERAKAEYADALEKDRFERLSGTRKLLERAGDTYDAAKNIMTTGELSFIGRQGFIQGISHPVRTAKALPASFKALFADPITARAIDLQTLNDPAAPGAREAGIHLDEPGTKLAKKEEIVMSNWGDRTPIVRNFNQAGRVFLNKLRLDSFKALAEMKPDATPAELEQFAKYVNQSTGRGSLGTWGERNAVALSRALFSPRFLTSRFQYLAGNSMWGGTAATRKILAKEYARTLIGLGTMYSLYEFGFAGDDKDGYQPVNFDPRSAMFGKMKIKNTTIDPLAGLSQAAVFAARTGLTAVDALGIETGPQYMTNKGALVDLREPKFGQDNWADVALRFGRSKLHPIPGSVLNLMQGRDLVGQPATIKSEAINFVSPMTYPDIYDALRAQDVDDGTAITLLALLGAGINTYQEKEAKLKAMKQPQKQLKAAP